MCSIGQHSATLHGLVYTMVCCQYCSMVNSTYYLVCSVKYMDMAHGVWYMVSSIQPNTLGSLFLCARVSAYAPSSAECRALPSARTMWSAYALSSAKRYSATILRSPACGSVACFGTGELQTLGFTEFDRTVMSPRWSPMTILGLFRNPPR